MRKFAIIVGISASALILGACRQEPTAKPVDDGTDVTAQTGATPEPAPPAADASATPPGGTETPATTATASPTPEASASPAP